MGYPRGVLSTFDERVAFLQAMAMPKNCEDSEDCAIDLAQARSRRRIEGARLVDAHCYSMICFSLSLCAFGIAIISVTTFCIASPVVGSISNFSRRASSTNTGS